VEAGVSASPDDYDDQISEAAKEQLAEVLLERVPDLPGARFGRGWAGLYPCSFDGLPLVGCIDPSEPNIITAAGAGGYGIQLGPVIGQLAADWVLEGAPVSIPAADRLAPTADRNKPVVA
jgi:sarcosine oxidase subunit beta